MNTQGSCVVLGSITEAGGSAKDLSRYSSVEEMLLCSPGVWCLRVLNWQEECVKLSTSLELRAPWLSEDKQQQQPSNNSHWLKK